MSDDTVLIFITAIVMFAFGYWYKWNNDKYHKEHPQCVCPKCHTKHRKGVDYRDE